MQAAENVVPFTVPPRKFTRTHKRTPYTLTFIPATKQWQWSVTKTVTRTYSGTASTLHDAEKTVKQRIDLLVGDV